MTWSHIICYFWIVNLEEQTLLSCFWVSLFRDTITWPTDLDKLFHFHPRLLWGWLSRGFFSFLCCTSGQVGLMLLSLCVSQVTSLIVMESQTQFALI